RVPFFTRRRTERQSDQWSFPTLLRFGVLQNFELRFWSQTYQSERFGPLHEVGFGPVLFDSKFHFWDQDNEKRIPAFGVQIMTLANLGSPQFSLAQWEPQFSLNFDYDCESSGTALEWNIGGTWAVGAADGRIFQGNFSWSVQQQLFPNLDGFVHGYLN